MAKALKLPLEARALLLAPLSLFVWLALIGVGVMIGNGAFHIDPGAHSGAWFFPVDIAIGGALAGLMSGWTISRFDRMAPKRTGNQWLYFLAASPFGVGIANGVLQGNGTLVLATTSPLFLVAAGIALQRRFAK